MSRKGNCWDNAVAESFFKTLKMELIYQNRYQTRKEAKLSIFEYIEGFYNTHRRHKFLENRTILEFNQFIINKFKIAAQGLRKFVHFFVGSSEGVNEKLMTDIRTDEKDKDGFYINKDVQLSPTEEEYRYNVEQYLTYVMPKEEFKKRFDN